jgi:hypothetical protein
MEKVKEFSSGALREDKSNKPYVHNLKGYTRLRFGYHMNLGSRAHGDSNWELGLPTSSYLESLDRHLAQYLDGDRSIDHLSSLLFNLQGIMINEQKEGIEADYYFNKLK